ncbi:hypothetical protein V7654_15150 [Bacillus sp. JJ1609]|uniref:hypothetical protein n=1 Tax=Bacillus sp. JJ1609 TaxID=3122977 RepID=UPI0030004902
MEQTEEYKLYVTSKTKIQMVEATLEELHTKKFYELDEECVTEIQFGTRIEIADEENAVAFLKTDIKVSNREVKEPGVMITVIYKGRFESKETLDQFQFETWIDPQVVPQLLPYTRVLISNLTNLLGVTPPVNLPTIDILETIKANDPPGNEDGKDNGE